MVENLTRRSFLKLGVGVVAVSILPASSWGQSGSIAGQAHQRIDGFAKVTGQKVYARDFSSTDMGWQGQQWYALFARALTTGQIFERLDLSSLPEGAIPTKLIYGDELHTTARAPRLKGRRDLHIDTKGGFDSPGSYVFDLVVQRGNAPNFLGQAVALMLFDSVESYRAARAEMQFQDAKFQVYGAAVAPPPAQVFDPTTWFVRYDHLSANFSYAQENAKVYDTNAPFFAAQISNYLATTPTLIKHSFTAEMRAIDPMFMEPESGLVWDDQGHLKLVLGTQSPDGDIKDIAAMYDSPDAPVKLTDITLKSCYPGGGFGGRDSSPFSLMLALTAPYAEGNPVRLEYDRFEQFRVGLKRHACTLSGLVAVTPEQKIMVNQMDFTFDGGGRKNLSPYVGQLAALCSSGAYDIPMANVHAKAIHSENISGGSQRGFGGPQAYFAIETALDDICAAQGWDPFDLRQNNILVDGGRTISGGKVEQSLRLSEMLNIARTHPVWADRAAIKARYGAEGLTYGTGMAISLQAYGTSGDGVVASVEMDAEGNITVASDAVDMGNGSATTLATVVGKILGRNAGNITMGGSQLFGETGLTDTYGGSWKDPKWTAKGVGSSSACLTGLHHVHVAEQSAKALFMMSFLPQAQNVWGLESLTAAETAWVDGALTYRPGGKPPLPQADLAKWNFANMGASGALAHGFIQGTWASGEYDIFGLKRLEIDGLSVKSSLGGGWGMLRRQSTITPKGNPRAGRYAYAPAVNLIGLMVDSISGRVQVEHSVTVLNAGRIHVEPFVSGQAQGGLAMALGWALLEDMPAGMDGPANGTWNLNKYHVPRSQDLPLHSTFMEGQRSQELIVLPDNGEAPGRGIAEAVMVSIAPAISNALRDATGARFTSLPITPAKILEGWA